MFGPKKSKVKTALSISLQALEQRILLDAAAVSTAIEGMQSPVADAAMHRAVHDLAIVNSSDDRNDSASFPLLDGNESSATEVVFIDSAVADRTDADIKHILNTIDDSVPVYFLDSASDGVDQISAVLAGYSELWPCLLYTSPSPRDGLLSRMPSSA